MNTFQIILTVFLGVAGFLPDLLVKNKEKTTAERNAYKIKLSIIILISVLLLIDGFYTKYRQRSIIKQQVLIEKKEKEDRERITKCSNIVTQIMRAFSDQESNLSSYENTLSDIIDTKELLEYEEINSKLYKQGINELHKYEKERDFLAKKIKEEKEHHLIINNLEEFYVLTNNFNKNEIASSYKNYYILLKSDGPYTAEVNALSEKFSNMLIDTLTKLSHDVYN